MTYEETLAYIHSVTWMGSRPGTERITELMHRLGDVQNGLHFVHVTGTNGKGSFCVMTDAILRAAGYHTGLFTSPFLWDFRERIQIDGHMVSREMLISATEEVRACADTMSDPPTEFELITAIGMVCFARAGCEIVVLEVGMGGLMDSTNVISSSVLSVVTGVALDHCALLGDTVEKIAAEKAGIIKAGCPVLYGGELPSVRQIIAERAASLGAAFHTVDRERMRVIEYRPDGCRFRFGDGEPMFLSLAGTYQPYNAATVLTAVDILRTKGLSIPDDAVREGLKDVYWPGRFECLIPDPLFYYDGGHNPQGVAACMESLRRCLHTDRVILLTGVMGDKDFSDMVDIVAPHTEFAVTLRPDNGRALSPEAYADAFRARGIDAVACPDELSAVQTALGWATDLRVPVLALGSLYMYRQIRTVVEKITGKHLRAIPDAE